VAAAAEVAHLLAEASGPPLAAAKLGEGVERLTATPDDTLREEGACQVRVGGPRRSAGGCGVGASGLGDWTRRPASPRNAASSCPEATSP
jgi:hypothetical protein